LALQGGRCLDLSGREIGDRHARLGGSAGSP
jgi:hypothetical protein